MYLDNAATTPLTDSVKEYVISILDKFGTHLVYIGWVMKRNRLLRVHAETLRNLSMPIRKILYLQVQDLQVIHWQFEDIWKQMKLLFYTLLLPTNQF